MNAAVRLHPFFLLLTAVPVLSTAAEFPPDEKALAQGKIMTQRLDPPDRRTYAGRVWGVIEANVDSVWSLLGDYNHMSEYMPAYSVGYLVDGKALAVVNARKQWKRRDFEEALAPYRIDTLAGDTVYLYNVIDIPFPLADRWSLLKVVRDGNAHTVQWQLVAGNMITSNGSWEIRPFRGDDNMTSSDSGIFLPQFVISTAFSRTLPSIIKQLRSRMLEHDANAGRGTQ
jgi:hypothetical protein